MDRRKNPRKNWVISKDDVGRAILEWKVDAHHAKRLEADSLDKTYDFLERLEVPDLALEDDAEPAPDDGGMNPYDTGLFKLPKR